MEYQQFIQTKYLYIERSKKFQKENYWDKNLSNQVNETEEQYLYVADKSVNNEHDKIFRRILDNKKEASKFITKALKLSYSIKEDEIEKYNSSFVTNELKNQEADIIYKLKSRNVFFLIEHQTKIDYTMPFRILEYENAIMRSAIDKSKMGNRSYKLPMVISIVLYSGRRKWNAKKYIREMQEELEGYTEGKFAKYNVVDVNDFSEKELLQETSLLSKAMLIEKTRQTDNLVQSLDEIVKEMNSKKDVYTKEQKELLITIIEILLKRKLTKEKIEELIKKLKEEKEMLAVLEMIDEENKRIFEKGERKGEKRIQKEYVKKMLKLGAPIEFIIEVTGLEKEKIEKMQKKNKK